MNSYDNVKLSNGYIPIFVPKNLVVQSTHLILAISLLIISIACFLVSTELGIVLTLVATLALAIINPMGLPVLIICAFLFQNTIIAIFSPLVAAGEAFDILRGANFVILVSATSACILGVLVDHQRLPPETRKWLLACFAVVCVVIFYLALGVGRGKAFDALVYFRNIFTPLACFAIGLITASLYSVNSRSAIVTLGVIALVFGYCEMMFGLDFLSVVNGDEYIERQLTKQINSGYWEKFLKETGFVLRGLEDVMMTRLFNIPGSGDILPLVFRLNGPNFHPISFAYSLAIISIWLAFQNRYTFLILSMPLLLTIGSKGAMVAVLMMIMLKIANAILPSRVAILGCLTAATAYIILAITYGKYVGDYHVLGFFAGVRDFFGNPAGMGLGFGGILSSSVAEKLDWSRSQGQGVADIPVESAVGVLLYQMGICAFVYFGFMFSIARKCVKIYLTQKNADALCGFMLITILGVNGVLQEEAFFSPLALGFVFLLVGQTLGLNFAKKPA